ncbi:MAG: ABC transporter substrate-binding protein [Cryobacterium sp.]|nr:ABC transporter substrate-binding protein [Cryobacterium sp.]
MVETTATMRGSLSRRPVTKLVTTLAAAAGFALVVAGCSTPAPEPTPGDNGATVETVRYINNAAQPLVGLAGEDQGIFAANNVKVEFTELATGTEAIAALVGGSADFVTGADARLIQAASQELPVVAIGIHNTGFLGSLIVDINNTTITKMEDLVGKNLGIQVGSGIHNGWLRYIEAIGLSESDFNVVNLKVPDMPSAISAGSIDAAITWQPYTSRAASEGLTKTVMTPDQIAGPAGIVYPFYLLTSQSIIDSRPDAVQQFVQAWVCTQKWINDNPVEAVDILAPAMEGLEMASVQATFDEQSYTAHQTLDQAIRSDTENQAKALVSVGAIPSIPDLDSHMNSTFVDAALSKGC